MREEERVTPLELFFDLVFVLALTQCTALMAANATWEGIGQGLLVLGLMWWAWTGYAWLTSVVEPEEGAVRHRDLRRDGRAAGRRAVHPARRSATEALLFACAYGIVRYGQIALFLVASRDEPALRRSVLTGLVGSTALSVALLVGGVVRGHRVCRRALWALALALDMGGPHALRRRGLEARPRPLRRAPRPDRDHRAGRVDRRDRRGRRVRRRRRRRDRGRARHRGGGRAVVALLRRRRAGRGAAALAGRGRRASRTRSRATRTPSCTSRWWPGSSCWRSA